MRMRGSILPWERVSVHEGILRTLTLAYYIKDGKKQKANKSEAQTCAKGVDLKVRLAFELPQCRLNHARLATEGGLYRKLAHMGVLEKRWFYSKYRDATQERDDGLYGTVFYLKNPTPPGAAQAT